MSYGEWCPTCGSPIIAVTRGIPSMGRCENGHETDRRNCLRGEPLKEDKDATLARLQRELAEAQRDNIDMMWQRRRADERADKAEAGQTALIGAGFSLGVRAAEKLYVNHGLDFDASLADQMLSLTLDSKAEATAALAAREAEARKAGMLRAAGQVKELEAAVASYQAILKQHGIDGSKGAKE